MRILSFMFVLVRAGIAGAVVAIAAAYGLVALKGPVFHWEMAGMTVTIIAAFVGGVSAATACGLGALFPAVSARPIRLLIGALFGTSMGLSIGLLIVGGDSVNDPAAPEGIEFWTVVTLAVAGFSAGLVGALMPPTSHTS
jgi:hypothetical protein